MVFVEDVNENVNHFECTNTTFLLYFAALRHAKYEVLSTEVCDLERAISYILKRCSFKVVIEVAEVQLRFLREMKGNYCSGES